MFRQSLRLRRRGDHGRVRRLGSGSRAAMVSAAIVFTTAVVAVLAGQRDARGQWVGVLDEHPAIAWATRPTSDRIAALNSRLESGQLTLTFEPGSGYLRAVLEALDLPVASQMLILSRTGVQRTVTSPDNPRALFYNEHTAVGFIRRSPFLELITQDPVQGPVFYTLDQRPAERPAFTRQTSCVTCHVATATLEVPGFLTRSLAATADGTLRLRLGSETEIDHRTPFARRWGGWFVTGQHGTSSHRGNIVYGADDEPRSLVPGGPLNVRALEGAVDLGGYPSAQSDVVALAVFDHQTRALNLVTRLGWEARVAAHEGRAPLETPVVTTLLADLVDYLLFVGEAPMPGGLAGRSGFAAWFSARGAKDGRGRTLHALDLTTRLMRYPLSYTVDSAAFDGLPDEIRTAIYQRLARVLVAGEADAKYAHLSSDDRRAIVEILRDTKADARTVLGAGLP